LRFCLPYGIPSGFANASEQASRPNDWELHSTGDIPNFTVRDFSIKSMKNPQIKERGLNSRWHGLILRESHDLMNGAVKWTIL
jgi:hypothetical protein